MQKKVSSCRMEPYKGLLALPTNIRLWWKWLTVTNTLAYCWIHFCRKKFCSCRVVFCKGRLPALPTNIRLWWKNTQAYCGCDYGQKVFLPVEWSSLVLLTNIGLQWKLLTVTNTLACCGCNYTRKKFYSCIMAFCKGWLLALPTNIRQWWKWLTV